MSGESKHLLPEKDLCGHSVPRVSTEGQSLGGSTALPGGTGNWARDQGVACENLTRDETRSAKRTPATATHVDAEDFEERSERNHSCNAMHRGLMWMSNKRRKRQVAKTPRERRRTECDDVMASCTDQWNYL
ncbi:hypothetical protein DPEC_G00312070 [Dallia pectoralis]|uniref:Uncharacterized protein n=1 Tax=Dallia pectoralis TaxID=75939 RepID=A0ACC2FBP8_DALPE|nr:hypothetical protein DPEC_G00312070 [Dallia pectoralis]